MLIIVFFRASLNVRYFCPFRTEETLVSLREQSGCSKGFHAHKNAENTATRYRQGSSRNQQNEEAAGKIPLYSFVIFPSVSFPPTPSHPLSSCAYPSPLTPTFPPQIQLGDLGEILLNGNLSGNSHNCSTHHYTTEKHYINCNFLHRIHTEQCSATVHFLQGDTIMKKRRHKPETTDPVATKHHSDTSQVLGRLKNLKMCKLQLFLFHKFRKLKSNNTSDNRLISLLTTAIR